MLVGRERFAAGRDETMGLTRWDSLSKLWEKLLLLCVFVGGWRGGLVVALVDHRR